MIELAMLFWVGCTLSAPTWFWWCLGIRAALVVINFGVDMYKI